MKNIQLFNVSPALPEKLAFLETLARNMWWCWNVDATDLFRHINPKIWKQSKSNPLKFLGLVPQKRLETLAGDDGFLSRLAKVEKRFVNSAQIQKDKVGKQRIAYFSLEFGIHESVKIYSGGLGVLAGDHLKAASDMQLPLVSVGLLYRRGYFQQYLDGDGVQQERYPENDIHHLPLKKALDKNGNQVRVSIPFPEGEMKAVAWQMDVGRIPLILLDTNVTENSHEFRGVTEQLYGGDKKNRLRQELVLGVGGFRALLALGYDPSVCHMNEGHAAFLNLAKIEYLTKQKGVDVKTAMEIVPRTNVFTTHTPVPAGNEVFSTDLLMPYLEALQQQTGLSASQIIKWGQAFDDHAGNHSSMTVLGLRMAKFSNGVSRLHGEVARRMWSHLWPDTAENEVPINHVTNGVHAPSWLSAESVELFDRYIGPDWREHPGASGTLERISNIPKEELWRAHEMCRSRLIRSVRTLAEDQYRARNATRADIAKTKSILDHDVLTIGFARRFATYKRGNMLLSDPQRLEAMLTDDERPIQILFAGKAHPADEYGKEFIRQIVHFARKANVQRRIVFLENYDISIARRLVQGVDVWLNTPRRPQEASGTSGMKAALNGCLNLSILDGWWCEGYDSDCGWAIGNGEEYEDTAYQDSVEVQALYNLLENSVIPTFYDRDEETIPFRWIEMMYNSIRMSLGFFTSHRMVSEYSNQYYSPALAAYDDLLGNKAVEAKTLVEQRERLESMWEKVSINLPVADGDVSELHVGDKFNVSTNVQLGDLQPDEVDVEVYYGTVNTENDITDPSVDVMATAEQANKNGQYVYKHEINCKKTGRYGFITRVTPRGKEWAHTMPGFITWANGTTN